MDDHKILVVDGDIGTSHVVCSYLEAKGYAVLEAHDGRTALQTVRQERPDLVVLELMLSDMDGLDVLGAIRRDRHVFRLPIIILSARASDADKHRGLDLGADDYIPKPFNPRELVARVGAVLRRSYQGKAGKTRLTSVEKQSETGMEQ